MCLLVITLIASNVKSNNNNNKHNQTMHIDLYQSED